MTDEDFDATDDEQESGDEGSSGEMGDEEIEFDPWGDDEEPVVAVYGELTPVPYSCAACGEHNETQFDLSGGYHYLGVKEGFERMAYYVNKDAYRSAVRTEIQRLGATP